MPFIQRLDTVYKNPIRETTIDSGKVRGVPGGNYICTVFKGIPFAKPPVGDLRWKKPQPVEPWEGVRECYNFGPAAYQLDRAYEVGAKNLYPTPYEISEDCLYINVWTPAERTDEKLPVFFWTHGGGNFGGFGHELENDGEGFAKRGVILVTYNYRLNAFGFLAHPELSAESEDGTSGNYALYDAIAALDWVRRNIAAFGGDPDNITIGGQSAGCMMTMCLTVSPFTRGKYAKVIYNSGVHLADSYFPKTTFEQAEAQGVEFMKAHGCSSIAELRALPPEEIMRRTSFEENMPGLGFRQFPDDVVLKDIAGAELLHGNMDDVPFLSCVTADEGQREPGKRQIISQGSREFCENQLKLGRKPVYACRFSRMLPGDDDGAWHTSELFYMFETISRTWRRMTGYDFELQTRMADYFANFIKSGDPNGDGLPVWTPYTETNKKTMDLGTIDGMMDVK